METTGPHWRVRIRSQPSDDVSTERGRTLLSAAVTAFAAFQSGSCLRAPVERFRLGETWTGCRATEVSLFRAACVSDTTSLYHLQLRSAAESDHR